MTEPPLEQPLKPGSHGRIYFTRDQGAADRSGWRSLSSRIRIEGQRPHEDRGRWSSFKMMVERIRRMVDDILFYAKERNLRREEIDILTFAKDVIRVVKRKSKTLNITLVEDFDFSVDKIHIDAGFVHSALINILECHRCLYEES